MRLLKISLLKTNRREARKFSALNICRRGRRNLPRRAVLQLRQLQRLRRDLGVNSAGASVILDLVKQMEKMKREIARMQAGFSE